MLKQLRVKFICITMAVFTAMLCVIFALMYHFTASALESDALQMMHSIADSPIQAGVPDKWQADELHLPYFCVQINPRGSLTAVSGGYYDLSDEEQVMDIVRTAVESGTEQGILEDYGLRFCRSSSPLGMKYVFADISSERTTLRNLVHICIAVGVLTFGIFLGLSVALAQWAVKPVEKAWQQQKQFVADASHELKTPLTVIMTNAELLQSPQYSPEDQRQFSSSILTMSQQMRHLVEGLLDLARVDNGAVQAAFTQLDLSSLISDGLLPFEPVFFEQERILEAQIEEGIQVKGSTSHLNQVLEILLDNAAKYSSPGAVVRVTLTKQGSHALLAVSNPGEAISPADLKNIFKRFYRVDPARSRNGSYGLGLSIAQNILSEHKGKIWAESSNGINTFFVQLPVL